MSVMSVVTAMSVGTSDVDDVSGNCDVDNVTQQWPHPSLGRSVGWRD